MGMKTAVVLRSTLTLIRGTTRRAHLQVPAMANDQIIVIKFCFRCILLPVLFLFFVFFNKRSIYIRVPTNEIALELKRKGILQNTTLLKNRPWGTANMSLFNVAVPVDATALFSAENWSQVSYH